MVAKNKNEQYLTVALTGEKDGFQTAEMVQNGSRLKVLCDSGDKYVVEYPKVEMTSSPGMLENCFRLTQLSYIT